MNGLQRLHELILRYLSKLRKTPIKPHPNRVLPGDILVCEHTENGKLIHCAMYVDNNEYIESLPFYGVRKLHTFQRPWIWDKYTFYYVDELYDSNNDYNIESIVKKAIGWAEKQEFKRYQYWHNGFDKTSNYNPDDTDDKVSDRWMCSELIWAAYMNASMKEKLDKDDWINITDASKNGETQYDFVHVYSLLKPLKQFTPRNPPVPRFVRKYVK